MLRAFHSNWTRPFFARSPGCPYAVEPFELLTTALSALAWRRENGPIRMICDTEAKRYYDTLGLSFLWDEGVHPLLDTIPDDVNPMAFWAAGKLYAMAAMPSPCVMIDTDFICWKPLGPILKGLDAAAIHREDIMPDIYPDARAFTQTYGFDFSGFDWTMQPFNTALCYLADNDFKDLSGDALKEAISDYIREKDEKAASLVGTMVTQGTTPRRLTDLIGSLCDLTSGSGDKGTPIILVQGYFDNYTK